MAGMTAPVSLSMKWPAWAMVVRIDGFEFERSDMLAAVDVKFGACHIARIVRTQKINGLGHFFRLAETALWNMGNYLLRAGREDRGFNFTGGDGIHPHADRAEVGGHFTSERGEGCFRG